MRAILISFILCAPQAAGGAVRGKVTATEGEAQKKIRADIRYVGPGIEKRKPPDPSPAVVYLIAAAPVPATESKTVQIKQDGCEFHPRVLVVRVGTVIEFPNADEFFHNVFSYSKAKRFDLGRYPSGKSKEEVFDKKGLVEIRCDIHKHMRAYVHVVDNPYSGICAEDGSYSIPNVPPGKYTLVAWKEFFEPVRKVIEVTADGAQLDFSLSLGLKRVPEDSSPASCCAAR
jgi:plastocyanin